MNDLASPDVKDAHLEDALHRLDAAKDSWANTTIAERIAVLDRIKDALMPVSQAWALKAAQQKGIAAHSPLVGEEWLSGPYALMAFCNALMSTLSNVKNRHHLQGVPLHELPNGQLTARVVPHSIFDRLLLSGVTADVWMTPGITRATLAEHTAKSYHHQGKKQGKVALVLGAGNIAAIAPLDCLHKLFVDDEVVILKMNPVNDYLVEFLDAALSPLIEKDWLRIVKGDSSVGALLCNHPLVSTIHITGSGASHDAIVWGIGAEAAANKAARTPKNAKPITSELGGVSPTIVVPGPWSAADIAFQAEHVATQKLHNAGFNCIASQVLVLPETWTLTKTFAKAVKDALGQSEARPLYYPNSSQRLAKFNLGEPDQASRAATVTSSNQCLVTTFQPGANASVETTEVFAPALGMTQLPGASAEEFLVNAVAYATTRLPGTLGANILIHPKTRAEIGKKRFEEILQSLRYGTIAINAWTGLGFLSPQASWGAFPGHTPEDVQSGIGLVHNAMLFDAVERTVVEAPFRPFPRNLLSLSFTMLPRPPWFVTNKRSDKIGALLTEFQYRPSFLKLPAIFYHALQG